ncbi:metallothionein [Pseudomonas nicosulfuronedens]
MKPEVCQCPGCICELDGAAVRRGDRYYCCEPCAEGHGQDQSCRDPECPCVDKARERRSQREQRTMEDAQAPLDQSLEETFAAREPLPR